METKEYWNSAHFGVRCIFCWLSYAFRKSICGQLFNVTITRLQKTSLQTLLLPFFADLISFQRKWSLQHFAGKISTQNRGLLHDNYRWKVVDRFMERSCHGVNNYSKQPLLIQSIMINLFSTVLVGYFGQVLLSGWSRQAGFVQVMENLESHGIEVFQFPGLESHGI